LANLQNTQDPSIFTSVEERIPMRLRGIVMVTATFATVGLLALSTTRQPAGAQERREADKVTLKVHLGGRIVRVAKGVKPPPMFKGDILEIQAEYDAEVTRDFVATVEGISATSLANGLGTFRTLEPHDPEAPKPARPLAVFLFKASDLGESTVNIRVVRGGAVRVETYPITVGLRGPVKASQTPFRCTHPDDEHCLAFTYTHRNPDICVDPNCLKSEFQHTKSDHGL
jgi:hypothetical protein